MSRFSFLRSSKQAPASGKARSDYVADEEFNAVAAAPRRGKQKDAADPALPEKKRARRRLVGAITLSLTAAIVLPLAFDPEPKPLAQDVAIDVSSRIKTSQPAKAAAPESAPELQTAAAPPSAATVAAVAGTTAVAALAAGNASVKTAKTESKPAEAAPKPVAETKAAASEQSKYIIQVAALASQQKVNELQAKLKSAGIKSHTQKVATQNGERIRVRVGPMGSRKEADNMCAKLGKIGQQCTIIPA